MVAPKAAAPVGHNVPATQEVARYASLWVQSRQSALNYVGPSSESLSAEVAKLDAAVASKKVEAFQAATELDRQTGGAFLNPNATASRVALPFDEKLLARYKAANVEASRIMGMKTDALQRLTLARQCEQVKADFVSILATLIGSAA